MKNYIVFAFILTFITNLYSYTGSSWNPADERVAIGIIAYGNTKDDGTPISGPWGEHKGLIYPHDAVTIIENFSSSNFAFTTRLSQYGRLPNASELIQYLLVLRAIEVNKKDRSEYEMGRELGFRYFYPNRGQLGHCGVDYATRLMTNKLLDSFRGWLERNPDEMRKYKILLKDMLEEAPTRGYVNRALAEIDYPSFTKYFVKNILPIEYTAEGADNFAMIVDSLRNLCFNDRLTERNELRAFKRRNKEDNNARKLQIRESNFMKPITID